MMGWQKASFHASFSSGELIVSFGKDSRCGCSSTGEVTSLSESGTKFVAGGKK